MAECEIIRDRAWDGQGYCAIHCVWIRWSGGDPPDLCPVGEAQGRAEEAERVRDEALELLGEAVFSDYGNHASREAWERRLAALRGEEESG